MQGVVVVTHSGPRAHCQPAQQKPTQSTQHIRLGTLDALVDRIFVNVPLSFWGAGRGVEGWGLSESLPILGEGAHDVGLARATRVDHGRLIHPATKLRLFPGYLATSRVIQPAGRVMAGRRSLLSRARMDGSRSAIVVFQRREERCGVATTLDSLVAHGRPVDSL